MTKTDSSHPDNKSGLIIDQPAAQDEGSRFAEDLELSLRRIEQEVLGSVGSNVGAAASWVRAREIVTAFRPVPWFIWRLSNYVYGKSGQSNKLPEGMVFGLRRLVFAVAGDGTLGQGAPISDMRKAMKVARSDTLAAAAVIHAVIRRLASCEHSRFWKPIVEDAVLRAEIGFHVGLRCGRFGPGRGMLAGFAGRIGLALLIAQGKVTEATAALEKLAIGMALPTVGFEVYNCDPLQISAMTLSACGCGRDAAFGTTSYATPADLRQTENEEQELWLSAFTAAECLRMGCYEECPDEFWNRLGHLRAGDREYLQATAINIIKAGGHWRWLGAA